MLCCVLAVVAQMPVARCSAIQQSSQLVGCTDVDDACCAIYVTETSPLIHLYAAAAEFAGAVKKRSPGFWAELASFLTMTTPAASARPSECPHELLPLFPVF